MTKAVSWITQPLKHQWIIALVAAAATLVAGATTDARADPPGANRMKVMSWNIHAYQGNFDGWVDTIGKLKPAVAGLNEVCGFGLEQALAEVEGRYGIKYHMQFKRWVTKPYRWCDLRLGYSNAIISIYPMTDVESHKYKEVDGEDRGFTVASINVPGISKIRVYVTHLGLRGNQGFAEEAEQLAAF